MNLHELIEIYIQFKRSLGMRFFSDALRLRAFCRAMGDIDIEEVKPAAVLAFIAGSGPVTARWYQTFKILRSFYRYAIGRGFVSASPLPVTVPKMPPPLAPYVYSTEELQRLVAATVTLQTPKSPLHASTLRTLLLLLYGTGMRVGEALSLTFRDVDLKTAVLSIRNAKFFKQRLVPIGPRLAKELDIYASQRRRLALPEGEASAFFAVRTGRRLPYNAAGKLFRRVRNAAAVRRDSTARYQPRLHDLRHTAATHRLIAWHRAGLDVQSLLPQLATFLGHKDITGTQRYISMTPELLQQAGRRFERYAKSGERP